MTPLMLAACQSSDTLQKVRTLLESGAFAQTRSNDGYTALDCARTQARLLSEGLSDAEALRSLKTGRKQTLENIKMQLQERFEGPGANLSSVLSAYAKVFSAETNEQIQYGLEEFSRAIQLLEAATPSRGSDLLSI